MTNRRSGLGIRARAGARAVIATALLAVLAACGARSSTTPTPGASSVASLADPPAQESARAQASAPAQESDLPEVVVTARAPRPSRLARTQGPRPESRYE